MLKCLIMSFISNCDVNIYRRVIPFCFFILLLYVGHVLGDEADPFQVPQNDQIAVPSDESFSLSSVRKSSPVSLSNVTNLSKVTPPELDPVIVNINSSNQWSRPSRNHDDELDYGDGNDSETSNDEDPPAPEIPKDETEARVRNFKSDHESPREVPTKVVLKGDLATPAPDSGINLEFVPKQSYVQVRRTDSVKRLPQSEAYAASSTPEERSNAGRLREVVSHKKSQEIYEEQGYEDSAYDHGGYKKKGELEEEKVAVDKGHHKPLRQGKGKSEESLFESSQRKNSFETPQNSTAEKLIFYPKIEAAVESMSSKHKPSTISKPVNNNRRPQASYNRPITHFKKPAYSPVGDLDGAIIEKFVIINGKQIPIFRKNLKPMKHLKTRVSTPDEDENRLKSKKRLNKKKAYFSKNNHDVPTTYHPDTEHLVTSSPKVNFYPDTVGKHSHSYNRPNKKFTGSFYSDARLPISPPNSPPNFFQHNNPGPLRYFNKVEIIQGKPKQPTRNRYNQNATPSFPDNSETQINPPRRPNKDLNQFKVTERPVFTVKPPTNEISIFGDPDDSPWVPIIPPPEYQKMVYKNNELNKPSSKRPHNFEGSQPYEHFPVDKNKFSNNAPDYPHEFPGEFQNEFPNEFPMADMRPPKPKLPQKHLRRPNKNNWPGPINDFKEDFEITDNRPTHGLSNFPPNHIHSSKNNKNLPVMIKTIVRPYEADLFDDDSEESPPDFMKHGGRKPATILNTRHPTEAPLKYRNVKKVNKSPAKYPIRENDYKEPYEPTVATFNKQNQPESFTNFERPLPIGNSYFSYEDPKNHNKKPYRKPPPRQNSKVKVKNHAQFNNNGDYNSNYNKQPKTKYYGNQFSEFKPYNNYRNPFENSQSGKPSTTHTFGNSPVFDHNFDNFPFNNDHLKNPDPYNQPSSPGLYPVNLPPFNVQASYSFEPAFPENFPLTTQPHLEVVPTYPSNIPVQPPTTPLDSSKFFSENHEYIEPKPPQNFLENGPYADKNLHPNFQDSTNKETLTTSTSSPSPPTTATSTVIPTSPMTPITESTEAAQENKPHNRQRWRPRKQPSQNQSIVESKPQNNSRGENTRRRNRPKTEQTQSQPKLVSKSQAEKERDSLTKSSNTYYPSIANAPTVVHLGPVNADKSTGQYYIADRPPLQSLHYNVPDQSYSNPIHDHNKSPTIKGPLDIHNFHEGQSTKQVIHVTASNGEKGTSSSVWRPSQKLESPPRTYDSISEGTESKIKAETSVIANQNAQGSKTYQTVPRQNFTFGDSERDPELAYDMIQNPVNSRHPFLPIDAKPNSSEHQLKQNISGKANQSDVLLTFYGAYDMPKEAIKTETPAVLSDIPKKPEELASIKYIENLTLQHYSVPENTLPYQPLSNTQQNRIINIANELNKEPPPLEGNQTNRRQDLLKNHINTEISYPYTSVDGRDERSLNFSTLLNSTQNNGSNQGQTQIHQSFDMIARTVQTNKNTTAENRVISYSDLFEQLENQKKKPSLNNTTKNGTSSNIFNISITNNRTRRSIDDNQRDRGKLMLLQVATSGTTTVIPVDVEKFPFYMSKSKNPMNKYSPLKYAQNPKDIPRKTGLGMEFYKSRSHIECDNPTGPQNVVPTRGEDGEWNENPQNDNSRLPSLGDNINCFKKKYFDEDPLDNPFFKEDFIGYPEVIRVVGEAYHKNKTSKNTVIKDISLPVEEEMDEPIEEDESEEEEDNDEDEDEDDDGDYLNQDNSEDEISEKQDEEEAESTPVESTLLNSKLEHELGLYHDVINNIQNVNREAKLNKSSGHTEEDIDLTNEHTKNNELFFPADNIEKEESNHLIKPLNDQIGGKKTGNLKEKLSDQKYLKYNKNDVIKHVSVKNYDNHKKPNRTNIPELINTQNNFTYDTNLDTRDSLSAHNEPKMNHIYSQFGVQNIFQNRTEDNKDLIYSALNDKQVKDLYKTIQNNLSTSKPPRTIKTTKYNAYRPKKPKIIRSRIKNIKKRPISPANSIKNDIDESHLGKKTKLTIKSAPSKKIVHVYEPESNSILDWLSPLDNLIDEAVDYSEPPIRIIHNFYNFNLPPKPKQIGTSENQKEPEEEKEYSNYYSYSNYDENNPSYDPESNDYYGPADYSQSRPADYAQTGPVEFSQARPATQNEYGQSKRKIFDSPKVTLTRYPVLKNPLATIDHLELSLLHNRRGLKSIQDRKKRETDAENYPPKNGPKPFSKSSGNLKSSSDKNFNASAVNNFIYGFINETEAFNKNKSNLKNSTGSKMNNLERITEHLKKLSHNIDNILSTQETIIYPKVIALREIKVDSKKPAKPIPGFVSRHSPVYSSKYNKELVDFKQKPNATVPTPKETSTITTSGSVISRLKLRFPPRSNRLELSTAPKQSILEPNISSTQVSSRNIRKLEDISRRPKHVDVYESLRRLKGNITPDFIKSKTTSTDRPLIKGLKTTSDESKNFKIAIGDSNKDIDNTKSNSNIKEKTQGNQHTDTLETINPMKDSLIYVVSPETGEGQWMKEVKIEFDDVPWRQKDIYESKKIQRKTGPLIKNLNTNRSTEIAAGFHHGQREKQHRKTPSRSRGPPSDLGSSNSQNSFEVIHLINGAIEKEKSNNVHVFSDPNDPELSTEVIIVPGSMTRLPTTQIIELDETS